MLRYGGKDVNGEPGSLRHVAGDEVRPALHEVGNESDVAGQTIKAGNEEQSTAFAAVGQRGQKLRPVAVPASALDLRILGHQLAATDMRRATAWRCASSQGRWRLAGQWTRGSKQQNRPCTNIKRWFGLYRVQTRRSCPKSAFNHALPYGVFCFEKKPKGLA